MVSTTLRIDGSGRRPAASCAAHAELLARRWVYVQLDDELDIRGPAADVIAWAEALAAAVREAEVAQFRPARGRAVSAGGDMTPKNFALRCNPIV